MQPFRRCIPRHKVTKVSSDLMGRRSFAIRSLTMTEMKILRVYFRRIGTSSIEMTVSLVGQGMTRVTTPYRRLLLEFR